MKTQRKIALLLLIFGLVFSAISLVNHYYFRTAALDLGMFNHALYNFAHLETNYFSLSVDGSEVNYFGDHFSPITLLYAPFYYVFGSYTLLVIQIAAVLLGAYGLFKLSQLNGLNNQISLILTTQFLSIWGIYSALAYDFHNNVVAAMLLPWLFVARQQNSLKSYLIFFVLILISKENMALWLIFIQLFFIVEDLLEKNQTKRKASLKIDATLLLTAAVYTFLVLTVIMPNIRGGEGFNQLSRYSHLGDSPMAIIINAIAHPLDTFQLLFVNTTGNTLYDGIKSEFHLMVLLSGGYALIRYPKFLILLIPLYGQNLLSDNYAMWGINGQYSIEFAPVLTIALITLISRLKKESWKKWVSYTALIITVLATFSTLQHRKSKWYKKENHQFYKAKHYSSPLNVSILYQQLDKIPESAVVCVSSNVAPHLANRSKIYLFPHIKDAEYVILITANSGTFPLNKEAFAAEIDKLMQEEDFNVLYHQNSLLVLKRKS